MPEAAWIKYPDGHHDHTLGYPKIRASCQVGHLGQNLCPSKARAHRCGVILQQLEDMPHFVPTVIFAHFVGFAPLSNCGERSGPGLQLMVYY